MWRKTGLDHLTPANAEAAKLVAYDGQKTMFSPKKFEVPLDGEYFKVDIKEDGRYQPFDLTRAENCRSRSEFAMSVK
jgi:hypothetical protein